MTSPSIAVNGRFLTHPVTGVERYATEIVSRMLVAEPGTTVIAPTGTARPDWVPEASWRTTGRLHGHGWEQIELPLYLHRHGRPVLVGLCNTGPVAYRRQVASHHDIGYRRFPENYSLAFRTWYRVMAWVLLRAARRVITVSDFSRRELTEAVGVGADKIVVVPNAVGPQFSPGDETVSRGAYAVAVGSPSVRKNTARLTQAWGEVHRATGVELLIVGDPLLVRGGGDAFGKAEGVTMVGRVDDEQLVSLYRRAQVSVLPSLYEGFGLPILEAQACGCPVVAADAAAMPEVLAGSGLLFDPYDPTAISAAVIKVLTDPVLAAELAAAGLRNVRRYSWDESAAQVLGAARTAGAWPSRLRDADGSRTVSPC